MVVVMADAGDADFRAELLDGIAPAVRAAYNVSGKVKQTGIAGIGRGASQALELAAMEVGQGPYLGGDSGRRPQERHGCDATVFHRLRPSWCRDAPDEA